jgi:hypothetical protein
MVACIYRSANLFGVAEEPITRAESESGGGPQQEEQQRHHLQEHHQQQETALNDEIDALLERVNASREAAEDATTQPEAVASKPSFALTSASQALSSVSALLPQESEHKNRQAPGVQRSPANVQSLAVDTRTNIHVEAGNAAGEDSRPNNSELCSKLSLQSASMPAAKSHGRFWQVCSYAFVSGCVCACLCAMSSRESKCDVQRLLYVLFSCQKCIFPWRAHT